MSNFTITTKSLAIKDSKCVVVEVTYPVGVGAWHEQHSTKTLEVNQLTEEQAKGLLRGLIRKVNFAIPRSNIGEVSAGTGFHEGILCGIQE